MAKSAAWGTLHLGIGFGVGCGISGSLAVAGALAVVEPLCNTVPHGFFDRWWDQRRAPAVAAGVHGGAADRPCVPSTHWPALALA
jgi:uncharacterized membrane protein